GVEVDTELRSNPFDLPAAGSLTLSYTVNYQNYDGSDFLDLDISTDGGTNWINLLSWNENHGTFHSLPGEDVGVDLSTYAGMDGLILRWYHYDPNANDWNWYAQVDDVSLSCSPGPPPAATPSGGSSIPPAHFPVVVYKTLPPPVIDVEPTDMNAMQDSGVVSTQLMTITNQGDSDLDWNIFENTLPIAAPMVDWFENFDSYAAGSEIIGQGGWEGWGGDPNAGATVTDTVSHSGPNSIDIVGPSDLVHQYSGYTTGWWTYSTYVYVPSTFDGDSFFILLNTYSSNWSTQVQFNSSTGLLVNDGNSGGQMPYITDQWVEIRV
ncbi:MAG: hypothetical protein GY792_32845, partial [Gammaproteobacteria bacterium]|nr:hypothetical protein [Gammaproteobacteria bacterium]